MYSYTSFLYVLVPDTAHISKFPREGFVTFVKSNAKALLTPTASKMQTRKRVLHPAGSYSRGYATYCLPPAAPLHLKSITCSLSYQSSQEYLYTLTGINELCIVPFFASSENNSPHHVIQLPLLSTLLPFSTYTFL